MKKILAATAVLLALGLGGCTDQRTAVNALDNLGFTNIQTTGYRFFSCGDDYQFHTGFSATNPRGKTVTGTVCSGWMKGSSVKFD